MALDPSIALGVRPLEVPNQLAQYAQMAQVENAQQQNALAQFQLGAARRAEQGQNALGQAYGEFYGGGGAGMGGAGAASGAVPGAFPYDAMRESIVQKLRVTAPHLIPSELAKISEMQQKALLSKETQGKIDAQAAAQIDKSLSVFRQAVPAINDADSAVRYIKAQYADPVLGKVANRFKPLEQTIEETIRRFSTPEGIRQWKIENAGITGDQLIAMMKQTTQTTDLGGQVRERQMDYFGQPVGAPTFTQKTPTIGDVTGQKRLAFDERKFAWEKANPGFELKEAEDGSIVGVNKRTLQAFPVTVGGAAPAAAPAMPGGGVPGARLPAPSAGPAAPGMAPPAAGAPGVPLMGKGTAMTETQSNAAMFGGAMAQAQNTIKQLEKSGTVKNAVVPGLLTGLAQMVPFGVGDGIGNVIQSTFNADPTGLIGPNADQQKLAQSQLAFATAYLRKTSGAAFGASEISNTIKEFFPLIGEGEKVIAQKAAARERAVEGMKISTNREGKKYIEGYGGGGAPAAAGRGGGIPNATPTNPLGLPGL